MRRKLMGASLAMMLGILAWRFSWIFAAAAAIAGIMAAPGAIRRGLKREMALMLALFYCAGCFLFAMSSAGYERGTAIDSEEGAQITVRITRVDRYEEEKYKMEGSIISAGGSRTQGQKILVSYFHGLDDYWQLLGKTVTFSGVIAAPKEAVNPRTFDYAEYLKTRRISHVTVCSQFSITSQKVPPPYRAMAWIIERREIFLGKLQCSERDRQLIRGVIFGDTKSMDEDMYDDFRANGTAHVLAVSGLHIGVIYSLYRRLKRRHRSQLLTGGFLIFLLFYGTITLWSVSVTRAIALVAIITLGDAFDRRYDLLTALGAVATGILALNPWALFGASFQMSFLAIVSISFFGPFLERFMPAELSVMLAVQLGMIPYTAFVFNYVPLISILCNIPVIYILSILVPAGIGALLFTMAAGAAGPPGTVVCALAELMLEVNKTLAGGGAFALSVVSPPLWAAAGVYCTALFLVSETFTVLWKRRKTKEIFLFLGLIGVITAAAFVQWQTPFDRADVIFVDVGQGDCIQVRAGRDLDLLIDGGGNINYDVGQKTLKPYLLRNGCNDIDLALATHLHTDHYLGLCQLKKCFEVGKTITSAGAGDMIRIADGFVIEVLWPLERDPDTDDENMNSLIFKIHADGATVLVTGDITSEGERALVEQYKGTEKLRCDVLKVAHHGSRFSSSDEFLEAVDPEVAVIGVGKNNYGHPSKDVIEKIEKKGIMLYRTDKDGAVGLICREGNISICTQRKKQTAASTFFSGR
jgi:competence protein ComEC